MGNNDSIVEIEVRKYIEINLDDILKATEEYVLESLLDEFDEDVYLPDVSEKCSDAINSIMKALGRKIIEKYHDEFEF